MAKEPKNARFQLDVGTSAAALAKLMWKLGWVAEAEPYWKTAMKWLDNAIAANKVVSSFGIERKGLVEAPLDGYNPPFLDGIWLRAPYLHNGSVPTLRDLLRPAEQRPKEFWRGYDLYDPANVGFVVQGPEAQRIGTRHDTRDRAGSSEGHAFGTALSAGQKNALIEYLKTL